MERLCFAGHVWGVRLLRRRIWMASGSEYLAPPATLQWMAMYRSHIDSLWVLLFLHTVQPSCQWQGAALVGRDVVSALIWRVK